MSYCVHCGVELADYEKDCPLCGTVVCDPHRSENPDSISLFPNIDGAEGRNINRRFLVQLFSVVLLIPFAVVAAIDLIFSAGLTWAFYVFGAELCMWVYFVLPVTYRNRKPYLYCAADTLITALYLFMIFWVTGYNGWFLPLALPLTLASGIAALLAIYILRRKNHGRVEKTGWLVLDAAMLVCAIDVFIGFYSTGVLQPVWSWFVTIPLIVLGVVLLVISHSVRMSEWIRRKLFI